LTLLNGRQFRFPSEAPVSKTFQSQEWTTAGWRPMRLRLDDDLTIQRRPVSVPEELGIVAALVGLGALVLLLI